MILLCGAGQVSADAQTPDTASLTRLVQHDCGSCHGLTLKGGLGPDIRPDALSHHDANSLGAIIANGIPGTPMPPWRPLLTQTEIDWIARYLLTGDPQ